MIADCVLGDGGPSDWRAVLDGRREWAVVNGDALELLAELPAGCLGAVVTDPPYSSGGMFRGDKTVGTARKYQQSSTATILPEFFGDTRDQRGFHFWGALWLSRALQAAEPAAMLATFSDWRQLPTMTDLIQAGGWVWRGVVPWVKANARPTARRFRAGAEFVVWGTAGGRDLTPAPDSVYGPGVLYGDPPPTTAGRLHATEKPVEVLRDIIGVAAEPGALVLDPFVGSGTTGVAALQLGRRFIGCELSPEFWRIAVDRLAKAAAGRQLSLPVDGPSLVAHQVGLLPLEGAEA